MPLPQLRDQRSSPSNILVVDNLVAYKYLVCVQPPRLQENGVRYCCVNGFRV